MHCSALRVEMQYALSGEVMGFRKVVKLPVDLTSFRSVTILSSMDPSRRIARDLKACIVAGPILLLMWVLKGCLP